MFSRLTIVRLKAAENALRDGRFDEAYRLATAPDLRDHRRAQKVLVKAAKKLIDRAKSHYDAGLYDEALHDLDRAAEAKVNVQEINRLRDEIHEAARQSRHRRQRKQRRLEAARQRIEAGSIITGDRILQQVDTADPRAGRLRKEAEVNARQAQAELDQVEKLLKQDQVPAAIERLQRAQSLNARDPRATELEARIIKRMLDAARSALRNGRTDRARAGLEVLGKVGLNDPLRHELDRNLELITRVRRTVSSGQYDEALRLIRQLRHLLPDVKWIKESEAHVQTLCETRLALMSGPLGIATDSVMQAQGSATPVVGPAGRKSPTEEPTRGMSVPVRHRGPGAIADDGDIDDAGLLLPCRMLMLVDGVGSFLILTQPRVSIGRMNAGPRRQDAVADITLMADISKHHADIARVEEDYFLFPHREVLVDGRPGGHRLLFDKNRVTLGKLARLTFRLPNAKTATAVLDLSSSVRMDHGVRQIMLFDRLAVLGAGPHCHVRIPSARKDLILYNQRGKLYLRPQPTSPEDRFDPHQKHEIRLGQSITVQDIGFCFLPWSDEGGSIVKTT